MAAMLDQLRRQRPKFAAHRGDVPGMEFLRHAKKLKREDQVVSPENHFHIGGVGPEASRGDVRHIKRIFELAQQKFLVGK